LFTVDEKGYNTGQYDPYFNQTRLDEIYEPIDKKLYLNLSLGSSGKFNFP
jgi:hypothetical protein